MNLLFSILLIPMAIINDTSGIRGGGYVNGPEFNYHVSIQSFLGSLICSGGIIDEKHIITAAHCVSQYDPSVLRIVAGVLNLNTLCSNGIRRVKKIHIHEGYFEEIVFPENATRRDIHCQYHNNDIAVLSLYSPLVWGNAIGKLALPTHNFSSCDAAIFAGWTEKDAHNNYEARLKWTYLSIFTRDVCRANNAFHAADQFCTTSFYEETQLIEGNSGGPLVVDGKAIGLLSGICENTKFFSFTNVYFYRDFITNIIFSQVVTLD